MLPAQWIVAEQAFIANLATSRLKAAPTYLGIFSLFLKSEGQ